MGGFWQTDDGTAGSGGRTAFEPSRRATMAAVVLLHLLLLFVLFTMRGPPWSARPEAPSLTLFQVPDIQPPPPTFAKVPRKGGGSPAAASAPAIDTSRALVPSPVAVADGANGSMTGAGLGDAAAGTGFGSAGSGVGTGGGAGSGDLPEARVGVTSPPAWVRRISDDELRPLLGGKLRRRGVTVSLRLSCEILETTRVRNCRVLSETPPDSGLGEVVPLAARYFRIAPARHAGTVIDGERIDILWDVDIRPARRMADDMPLSVR